MILLCPGCGHHAAVIKLPRHARVRCSICSSRAAKRITRVRIWHKWPEERPPPQAQRDTYAGLLYFAQQANYKPGWIAYRFRAIYDDWPSEQLEPAPPYYELVTWLQSENNRYKAVMRKIEK
jgi:hypothetical protein